jgi:hypothetical protein
MHCIDPYVIKQIHLEVDKASKFMFDEKQMAQVVENLVASRVQRHIIDTAHQMLNDKITIIIDDELNRVIRDEDVSGQVHYEAKRYLRSSEFVERIRSLVEYCDIHGLSKDITLKELTEFLMIT